MEADAKSGHLLWGRRFVSVDPSGKDDPALPRLCLFLPAEGQFQAHVDQAANGFEGTADLVAMAGDDDLRPLFVVQRWGTTEVAGDTVVQYRRLQWWRDFLLARPRIIELTDDRLVLETTTNHLVHLHVELSVAVGERLELERDCSAAQPTSSRESRPASQPGKGNAAKPARTGFWPCVVL